MIFTDTHVPGKSEGEKFTITSVNFSPGEVDMKAVNDLHELLYEKMDEAYLKSVKVYLKSVPEGL